MKKKLKPDPALIASDIFNLCYFYFMQPRSDKRDAIVEKQIENYINGKRNPLVVPKRLRIR